MDFALLGPLCVVEDGLLVEVAAAKQRIVLAALLLQANEVVSIDALIDAVWGADVPARPKGALRNHVMRLRQALGPAGGARIAHQPPGYLIKVAPGEVDLDAVAGAVSRGRAASQRRDWALAVAMYRGALTLWRGSALADVPSERLQRTDGERLGLLRVETQVMCIDAELHLGGSLELLPEIRQLMDAFPTQEQIHGQAMLAYARAGRRADALAAYRNLRRRLIDELGVEPGQDLQTLHAQILNGELPTGSPAIRGPGHAIAPKLPPDVADFNGRSSELGVLVAGVDAATCAGVSNPVISAVDGMVGTGKPAFVVHAAHNMADRFPDGQLFVGLHANAPGKAPVGPAAAVDIAALPERQVADRESKGTVMRIRTARFPAVKTLEDFDLDHLPSLRRDVLARLATSAFVAKADNVILLGPPGIGKTHLAIGLGVKATQAGYSVLFGTASQWITRLADAHRGNRLEAELEKIRRYQLIIVDEVGYIPFDQDAANLFFQLVASRYEQGSIMVTSNLPFGRWGETFSDDVVATAMIDRLVHHAEVLTLTGDSYRTRQRRELLAKENRASRDW